MTQHCLACVGGVEGCKERKYALVVIFSIGFVCVCVCVCVLRVCVCVCVCVCRCVFKARVSLYLSYPRTSIICGVISGLSVMCKLLIVINRKSRLPRNTNV
jgi:hypothetical protein